MALISSFFNCFGPSSNSSSQVYDEKSSQSKSSSSLKKPKSKEKLKGAPIIVSYFPINSNCSRL
ncbi:unnamed protein product [Lathyrus sativus]|nr:unnamed protein product [Lathyrus sativus]